MDINALYQSLKETSSELLFGNIKFYLIKERNNNDGVILCNLEIERDAQEDLLSIFNVFFQNTRTRNREQLEYDVVMDHTGKKSFLTTSINEYTGIKSFIQMFQDDNPADTIKDVSTDKFIAYAVEVTIPNGLNFIFVGEFSKLSKISRMKLVGNLQNNKFRKLDTHDTFGFSKNIAMVVYNDEVLINHITLFEKCCQMETEFKKKSAAVLKEIEGYGFIDNIEELIKTSERDSRIARRLTKMNSDPQRVEAFFTNKHKVREVLTDPEFKDKFEGIEYNGKVLKYDSKLRQQFITLISDAAYKSIVGGQKRIDNSL
ncbi:Kiwa anti-phage protein KwaB-like domain-containing protein [Enterococcus faecium]|uniref:Kiwa anti-phage protein KwaB-like domain-containing protein n=1 Tax=Enterococcus faecium TaxID=1352 RepID=UPI000CF0B8C0|nr:Kiwa anti-phage protein KwaB-like domain-containing protein [Enterococcus faecium]EGP5272437.1 DUF4868 domain-containing protein [Enterococcus faecium]MCO5533760.1 DUF4868 domain-containing protein [Enterococcus faecium]PQB50293.1 hypothetical protein CUN27_02430 [Enterococcus faecium]PQD92439.1 hypothetical protein CUM68_06255 [Enterococcus faecium]RBT14369.1 hypothetical protein EA93_01084 [Enterococcus faecium]